MAATNDQEPRRVLPPREEMPGREFLVRVGLSRKDQVAQQQQ